MTSVVEMQRRLGIRPEYVPGCKGSFYREEEARRLAKALEEAEYEVRNGYLVFKEEDVQ